MANSIESIVMVEASKELQVAQKNLLCGQDAVSTESDSGSTSVSKYGAKPITWTDSIKSIPIGTSHHQASAQPCLLEEHPADILCLS
jgi:hypothetical protein